MPDYIVNRAFHDGDTLTETGGEIAPVRAKRCGFNISVLAGLTDEDAIEVFLAATPGTAGTGIRVTAVTPLVYSLPYYGAISARAISGSVEYSIVESVG